MILLGVGAGLVIPCATASVMGSVPREHTGVGSATNGALLQVGGALGWLSSAACWLPATRTTSASRCRYVVPVL
jgi:hypothetical protein